MDGSAETTARISKVVHDLRAPLAIISAYAQRLEEPDLDDAERASLLETIHRNVDRMSGLIDQIVAGEAPTG